MYLAEFNQNLLDVDVVYLANPGSNTPHSVMINGAIYPLEDRPTFPFTAGPHPLPISTDDLTGEA